MALTLRFKQAAVVMASALTLLSAPAEVFASPVTLTGRFTTFQSWMFDPAMRGASVNGTLLTSTGVVVGDSFGTPYYLSDVVTLAPGTTRVDFGYEPDNSTTPPTTFIQNSFEFTPASGINVGVGEVFEFGRFQFTNGQYYFQTDLGFTITTSSLDPALHGHTFTGTLRLISNSTDGTDPETEADFFYFTDLTGLGSCRVYDFFSQPASAPGNVGTCGLNGRIGSLIPMEWLALDAGAFVAGSTTPGALDPTVVPEPATLLMLGGGLAAMVARRRRNTAKERASRALSVRGVGVGPHATK